jgi:predicted nucleic acid-binding Zn ribbon protein
MERIGDILDRAVVRPAKRSRSLIARVRRRWAEVAGEEVAAHSWPRALRRGVLTVEVDSSALRAELAGYRRPGILQLLAAGPRPLSVRDLRFVLSTEGK